MSERFKSTTEITKYAVNQYMKHLKQDIYQVFAHISMILPSNILPVLRMTHIRFSLLNFRMEKKIKNPNQNNLQINLYKSFFSDKEYTNIHFLLKHFIISRK